MLMLVIRQLCIDTVSIQWHEEPHITPFPLAITLRTPRPKMTSPSSESREIFHPKTELIRRLSMFVRKVGLKEIG